MKKKKPISKGRKRKTVSNGSTGKRNTGKLKVLSRTDFSSLHKKYVKGKKEFKEKAEKTLIAYSKKSYPSRKSNSQVKKEIQDRMDMYLNRKENRIKRLGKIKRVNPKLFKKKISTGRGYYWKDLKTGKTIVGTQVQKLVYQSIKYKMAKRMIQRDPKLTLDKCLKKLGNLAKRKQFFKFIKHFYMG